MQILILVTDAYNIGKAESVCRSFSQETCQLSGNGYIPGSRVIDWAILIKMIDCSEDIDASFGLSERSVFIFYSGNHDKFLKITDCRLD